MTIESGGQRRRPAAGSQGRARPTKAAGWQGRAGPPRRRARKAAPGPPRRGSRKAAPGPTKAGTKSARPGRRTGGPATTIRRRLVGTSGRQAGAPWPATAAGTGNRPGLAGAPRGAGQRQSAEGAGRVIALSRGIRDLVDTHARDAGASVAGQHACATTRQRPGHAQGTCHASARGREPAVTDGRAKQVARCRGRERGLGRDSSARTAETRDRRTGEIVGLDETRTRGAGKARARR
jgi:hypothetical protein